MIEAVAALFVMGVIVVSGITFMQCGTKFSRLNKERSIALFLLERKLEEISALPADEHVNGSAIFPEAQFSQYMYTVVEKIGTGHVPAGLEMYLKRVVVTVAWPAGDIKHQVEIETFLPHSQ